MYSRSVWYDEVDKALYNLIGSLVSYRTKEGELKNVVPRFNLTDNDLKEITYPTVLIRSIGEKFDLYRYDPTPVTKEITEGNKVVLEDSAKPYTLMYQLDFISLYKTDINHLLRTWYVNIPKRYLLDVVDTEGNPRKCYMLQIRQSNVSNNKKGELSLYRTTIQYDIKVELDEGKEYEVYGVSSVNLDYK